jgi:hypothetical protein
MTNTGNKCEKNIYLMRFHHHKTPPPPVIFHQFLVLLYYIIPVPASRIDLGEEVIISSASVRNLGVIFDANLKMDQHVSDLVFITYVAFLSFAPVRKF